MVKHLHRTATRALNNAPAATLTAGVVLGTLNIAWLGRYRADGPFNVDEAGMLSNAVWIGSRLGSGRWLDLVEQLAQPPAPVVPAIGGALYAAAGRTVTAALSAQTLFLVVAAVAAAGISARLGRPAAARVAGLVALTSPAVIVASRGYSAGPAMGAFLTLAAWAFVASDRGRSRWAMVSFGVAVGLMMLSRTMSVALLPSLGIFVAIGLRREPRSISNLGFAITAALIVAAPWWVANADATVEYLTHYGYGSGAGEYSSGPLAARPIGRLTAIASGLPHYTLIAVVVMAMAGLKTVRRKSSGRPLIDGDQEHLIAALVALFVGCWLTLSSSENGGWQFEVAFIPLAVATMAALSGRLSGRFRQVIAIPLLATSMAAIVLTSGDFLGLPDRPSGAEQLSHALLGGIGLTQAEIETADDRLAGTTTSARESLGEWTRVSRDVVRALGTDATPGRSDVAQVGSSPLLSLPSTALMLGLMFEDPPGMVRVDLDGSDAQLRSSFRSTSATRLAIVQGVPLIYPGDERAGDALRAARSAGWAQVERFSLPRGGAVVILERKPLEPRSR